MLFLKDAYTNYSHSRAKDESRTRSKLQNVSLQNETMIFRYTYLCTYIYILPDLG